MAEEKLKEDMTMPRKVKEKPKRKRVMRESLYRSEDGKQEIYLRSMKRTVVQKGVTYNRVKKERYQSRATRAGNQAGDWREKADQLESIKEDAEHLEELIEKVGKKGESDEEITKLLEHYKDYPTDVKIQCDKCEAKGNCGDAPSKSSGQKCIESWVKFDLQKQLKKKLEEAQSIVDDVDFSELESLTEEMTSWRDNMSGTGLENTSKYEAVDEAASTLEGIDTSMNTSIESASDIDEAISELNDKADELEGVDFPGMY